jgi:hypothetical protein
VTLISLLQSPIAAGTLAFAGFALLALALFVLRRGDGDAVAAARDFASISLEPVAPAARQVVPAPLRSASVSASSGSASHAAAAATWGTAMPLTRADAIAVLGIGVAPAATSSAIKKIVDGLRQSWHPDYASDPADRAMRELRSKQINAAWEILADKRATG